MGVSFRSSLLLLLMNQGLSLLCLTGSHRNSTLHFEERKCHTEEVTILRWKLTALLGKRVSQGQILKPTYLQRVLYCFFPTKSLQ